MNETKNETTALILAGDGYQLTIAPEAEARKQELLEAAESITTVTDNDESSTAQFASRQLAQMRIEVDKSRKLVKEPVIRIGKLIDSTAKEFLADLAAEESRIKRLVGDHASEVARAKAAKEAEERRAFEEARAAREEAERAAEAAANTNKIADVIAARQAEQERQRALDARMDASEAVANEKVADGVRFAWDFEVDSIAAVYAAAPCMCDISIRRSAVLKYLRETEDDPNLDVVLSAERIGITAFKKPVVSSR